MALFLSEISACTFLFVFLYFEFSGNYVLFCILCFLYLFEAQYLWLCKCLKSSSCQEQLNSQKAAANELFLQRLLMFGSVEHLPRSALLSHCRRRAEQQPVQEGAEAGASTPSMYELWFVSLYHGLVNLIMTSFVNAMFTCIYVYMYVHLYLYIGMLYIYIYMAVTILLRLSQSAVST